MSPLNLSIQPCSASSLWRTQQKITTNSFSIDSVLNGGFNLGHVFELCGESGTGKTQICLQACLSCQLPYKFGGAEGSSIYINTHGPFPSNRLKQVAEKMGQAYNFKGNPLDNVIVKKVETMDELITVTERLASIVDGYNERGRVIRLLVVDSVASLCRCEYGHKPADLRQRSNALVTLAMRLKEIASQRCLAVLLTNQVSDVVFSKPFRCGNYATMVTSGREVVPCLGFNWSNYVQTRLYLTITVHQTNGKTIRTISVAFSPHLPPGEATFIIDAYGVM